ncbi:MAG TPA: preprotein translocase subunit SecE [Solirubrobacteraceae bacterium]|nr:preprotein translocase subunit SecE [Solirubrobacteraceae bacterium]
MARQRNRPGDAEQDPPFEGPGLATAADDADDAQEDGLYDELGYDEDSDERDPSVGDDGGGGRSRRRTREGAGGEGSGGEVASRPSTMVRLVRFLQGSWRELHRVQWPDRPQVVQATGVVIGFVIVAGAFLAGADWVSQHIINFILK